MNEQAPESKDPLVFISSRDSVCDECKESLGKGAWITLARGKGALCLSCADLDHLVYLPSGDMALTRRARKHSALFAVVLKWSRSRRRYERQGLMVEDEALDKAEEECLADADARERRRAREHIRREELDQQYIDDFALRVRELYPRCPAQREFLIALHACQKYSGRVGRSASAKRLDEEAIRLAVIAHIRHRETGYDQMLSAGADRQDARASVKKKIDNLLREWAANE
ncbi:MAG: DUF2293 domain-containing protein [Blastocatellia bacterium]